MTIYFVSCGILGATLYAGRKTRKLPKSHLFVTRVPKYVTSWVIWVNLFTKYVINDNFITYKPREYLCVGWKSTKVPKPHFFCNGIPKYVSSWVIKFNLFKQYRMHDNWYNIESS